MGDTTRWVSLSAGLLLEAAGGTTYAFGLYSDALKTQLNYTQSDITTVGSFGNLGLYAGFLGGFTFDHFGPLVTGWGGGLLVFLGYFLMFLGSKQVIPHSVSAMGFYSFLWGHGCSWVDVAAVTTQAMNFPDDRGKVMGVIKAFLGLSASLFSVFYACFFKPHATPFLLFLAVGSSSVLLALTPTQRLVAAAAKKPLSANGLHRLVYCIVLILTCVSYLATVSILIGTDAISASPAIAWVLVPLLAFAFGPLLPVPWFRNPSVDRGVADSEAGEGLLERGAEPEDAHRVPGHESDKALDASWLSPATRVTRTPQPLVPPAIDEGQLARSGWAESAHMASRPDVVQPALESERPLPAGGSLSQEDPVDPATMDLDPQLTWAQGMCRLELWLLAAMLFAGTGSGLTLINNIGQVVKAINPARTNQATFVAFISIGSCLGRLFIGIGSDRFESRLIRPVWVTLTLSSMAIAMLISAFADESALYVACLWTGFSFGGFFSISPCLVGDLCGTKAFGSIFTTMSVASAAGGFLFSATMAPAIYAANTAPGDGNTCVGPRCFRDTFLILAGVCTVMVAAGVWMFFRTRTFYAAKNARKARHANARWRIEQLRAEGSDDAMT